MTTDRNAEKSSPDNNERRKVLKKLAIGTVAVAGCSVLPSKWTSPVVEFGALPAHAVTSGQVVEVETDGARIDSGRYVGRTNGDRPTWYFPKNMRDYPQQFTLEIDGCTTVEVTSNNGIRFESGETIIKQSDVPGRGMAVLTSPSCYSKTSHVYY